MDIHVDIRRFLEIHAWICYGLSDQGRDLRASCFLSANVKSAQGQQVWRQEDKIC